MAYNPKLTALVELSNAASEISNGVDRMRTTFSQEVTSIAHRPHQHRIQLGLVENIPDSRDPLWAPTVDGKRLNAIVKKLRDGISELDTLIVKLYEADQGASNE